MWEEEVYYLVRANQLTEALQVVRTKGGKSKVAAHSYVLGVLETYKHMSRQIQDLEDHAERLSGRTFYGVIKHTRYEGSVGPITIWSDKDLAESEAETMRGDLCEDQHLTIREYSVDGGYKE